MTTVDRALAMALATALATVLASPALAQLPIAQLTVVSPPGGKRGTAVEVTLSGNHLENLSGLHFSRPGLTATLASGTKFNVTVAADAPIGPVDVRAVGQFGISNPRTFWISDLPSATETEPNSLVHESNAVPLNVVVNGKIDGRADVDHFKFPLKKGQRVLIDCFAERIDSRLNPVLFLYDPSGRERAVARADRGREPILDVVAEADGDHVVRLHDLVFEGSGERFYQLAIHTQPVVEFAYPPAVEAGKPASLKLYGRNLPGGKPDPATVVNGVPLDVVDWTAPAPPAVAPGAILPVETLLRPMQQRWDAFAARPRIGDVALEPIVIGLLRHPATIETEPNDSASEANRAPIPTEFIGRLERPGDVDWIRFSGKQGQVIELAGISERAGYPTDLLFLLRRVMPPQQGQPATTINAQDIGEYDDDGVNVGRFKFITSSHDPLTTIMLPAEADYVLEVRDRYGRTRGDGRFVYRVVIAPPQADFRLAAISVDESNPTSIVVRQGGTTRANVFAVRQGGFAGEIRVEAVGLPPGVSAPPVVIGPNVNETSLVFVAEANAAAFAGPISIQGTAKVQDQTLVRAAHGATIVWPADGNAPRPARLTQEICFAVRENAPYHLTAKPSQTTFGQGSLVTLALGLERRNPDFKGALANVTAIHLPPNAANQQVNIPDNQTAGTLNLVFPRNVPVGTYSFIVAGVGQVPFTKTPQDPKAKKTNVPVSESSPPITVTILPRPCDLAANPNAPQVKAGESVAVKVTVNRANDYKGPVKLSLVAPPGVSGLSADPATVAADAKEATLTIKAAADAPAGDKPFVAIRGEAEMNGKPVTVDAIVTVKVNK